MPSSSHGGASHHVHIGHDVWIGHGAVVLPGRNDRHRRRGRGRRHRHQGRPRLHHRRRQSGAADQAAVSRSRSPTGSRSSHGGTGTMRRCAAPCPISASSMSRAFSTSTKPRASDRPVQPRVPHRDRTCSSKAAGPCSATRFVETSLRIAGARDRRRRRTDDEPWLVRHRCRRPAGAAGHRRPAWRCLRAADDAAPRRRFPDRRRAGRQRPAGDQQRHHDRLSRHDLVVGARPAQRATMRGNCWRRSNRCGRSSPPTPASICATRPTISTRKAKSSTGCREGRVDLFAFNDHMDSTVASLAKPQKRSRMVERTGLTNEAFDQLVQSVICREPRRAGLDRPAGAGGARGWRPDALA